ncbi:phage tail protein [Demequina mangrovi]|uniref:Phage tail protein, P2 protein I family n=1 Tax=Demequina mangrovi TaxID=1043493 RepID=A0A1H6TW83_9MICO|nr:phage tail protein [Demequina mangrovi]SEI82484.1 phage tail protein, P2 protein I family [Demequina mangrovi]
MHGDRDVALLVHEDQWARCAHDRTVLLPDGGVGLDWAMPPSPRPSRWDEDHERCADPTPPCAGPCAAGIAHDRWGRTWTTRPLDGTIEVGHRPGAPGASCPGALRHPTGIAIDARDRVLVAETVGRAVAVLDPWAGRVIRRVPMPGAPVDLVAHGTDGALVLTRAPHRLISIDGGSPPCVRRVPLSRPHGYPDVAPARVTLVAGRPVVLWHGGGDAVIAETTGREILVDRAASDIEGTPGGLLVVARGTGEPFRRLRGTGGAWVEDQPLAASGYDGGAVTVGPRGRIVYTTAGPPRSTQGSSARYARSGSVTTYRLDAGEYRTRWGRVFIDACLPTGTGLTVRVLTSDEDDVEDPLQPSPPGRGAPRLRAAEATPPLPSASALADAESRPVVARGAQGALGAVEPLAEGGDWVTYETGVDAQPGRYLWLRIELTGTARTSPRVRALRVERPGHALLDSLPRLFSSDDAHADFLHRYLTPAEGILHDLDTAAAERRTLIDAAAAPREVLPWLASFAGIVLDRRWSEEAQRTLIAKAYALYARRGTIGMLESILYLYLGRTARIVERWRLRGLGGAILGLEPEGRLRSPTVVGTAVDAGMLGHFAVGGASEASTAYTALAHRFVVLVPGCLDAEQREVVEQLIEAHKPSHTLGDVCEVGAGMPVGRLRLGMTAYVAPPAGHPQATTGQVRLGLDARVGLRDPAPRIGETHLGEARLG